MSNISFSTGAPRIVLLASALVFTRGLTAAAPSSASFRSFTNDAGITIVDESAATPYPSTIVVSGMTGVLTQVQVTLRGLNHSYPDDIDMLLVAPGGRKTILMSDAGGTFPIADVIISLDDSATPLPNSTQIFSGVYAPANWFVGGGGDDFPAPAPAGPYSAALGTFGGINPNGTWSLYVVDDIPNNDGNLGDGWSLTLSTAQESTSLSITRVGATARLSWPETSPGYTLETRASLQIGALWSTATNAVVLTNGQYRATVPLSDTQRFFRLRK